MTFSPSRTFPVRQVSSCLDVVAITFVRESNVEHCVYSHLAARPHDSPIAIGFLDRRLVLLADDDDGARQTVLPNRLLHDWRQLAALRKRQSMAAEPITRAKQHKRHERPITTASPASDSSAAGKMHIHLRYPAGRVRPQIDAHVPVDVEPFGMVVHFFNHCREAAAINPNA